VTRAVVSLEGKRRDSRQALDSDMSLSSRIICLTDTCQGNETHNTVDLCEDPRCLRRTVTRDDLPVPHLPTHDLLKTRRILQERDFGNVYRRAIAALRVSRRAMKSGVDPMDVPDRWTETGLGEGQTQNEDEVEVGLNNNMVYDPQPGREQPRCIACNCVVSWSCWYCTECPGMSSAKCIFLRAFVTDPL
jgi:hypothetical protein